MNTEDNTRLDSHLPSDTSSPHRIAVVYVVFALLLFSLSDLLLPLLLAGLPSPGPVETAVVVVEVGLTGGLVYLLTRRMADRLTGSEQRYRNLIETSPAPISLFDENGTIVWGNDATLDLLGLDDRDDLVGRSIFEFIDMEDAELAESELAGVIEDEQRRGPTAMRLRTDDGGVRRIRVSTAPGRYGDKPVGQAVVIDITQLYETEAELRAERDFVQNALDELRDLFYVVDAEGELQRWNTRVPEVTGYEAEELDEASITAFFEPEDQERILEALESTLADGETFVEADLVTKEGDHRRFEFKSAPLGCPGESDRVVGIGRDVTERRRMERDLRESEQLYRTLVEMSPHSILVHSDGEVVYANDAFVDLVGADSKDEVGGCHLNTFVPPEDYDDVAADAERTQRGKDTPTDQRRTVVGLDGTTRHIETTSRPIAYEDGPAVLTIIKDVTERHDFEEMLTTLHERTQAMTRAESRERTAEIAAGTATELLDVDGCGVYELGGENRLEPLAWSGFGPESDDDVPVQSTRSGILWDAFVDGEERVAVGESDVPGLSAAGDRSVVVLPLDNYGVIALVSADDWSPSTAQGQTLDLIVESVDAAFDRFEQEHDLRERDQRLELQNEALEQLNRLNEIIREITQTLIRATTRSEMLCQTCEQITAAEQYSFAWVGTRDSTDERTVPQYWEGVDSEYIDHIGSMPDGEPLTRLTAAAFRENEVQVAQEILDDPDWQSARSEILGYGFRSVAAVPIRIGEYVDSVLVIHAEEPDIFDEQEREVLDELGRTIGFALRTIQQGSTSQTGSRTELELSIPDERLVTNRITTELDATIEFVGAVPQEDESLHLFLDLTGVVDDDAVERLEALESVSAVRALAIEDGQGLYHITLSDSPLVRTLHRRGVHIRSLTAEDGISTLVGLLPRTVGVRPVVEEIQTLYPDTELVARREGVDPATTQPGFRDRLLDALTDRQREALQTAAYSGFYEWPRDTKSKELAEMLDIASSTYQYHLRAAERTMVNAVFEPVASAEL